MLRSHLLTADVFTPSMSQGSVSQYLFLFNCLQLNTDRASETAVCGSRGLLKSVIIESKAIYKVRIYKAITRLKSLTKLEHLYLQEYIINLKYIVDLAEV